MNVVPAVAGDFNLDGRLTADDVPAMIAALADLNAYLANRNLTVAELTMVGDLDGDGTVTNLDLLRLLASLSAASGGGSNTSSAVAISDSADGVFASTTAMFEF